MTRFRCDSRFSSALDVRLLKKLALRAGLDAAQYTGHSLRAGTLQARLFLMRRNARSWIRLGIGSVQMVSPTREAQARLKNGSGKSGAELVASAVAYKTLTACQTPPPFHTFCLEYRYLLWSSGSFCRRRYQRHSIHVRLLAHQPIRGALIKTLGSS
jgi:hypothetical protein